MIDYKNISGKSGVLRYEKGHNYIIVEFRNGVYRFYKYTYETPGLNHVEHMKKLADTGSGLNAYIKDVIGRNYESKS